MNAYYYDMTPAEREEFELNAASEWVDRKRDEEDEQRIAAREAAMEGA